MSTTNTAQKLAELFSNQKNNRDIEWKKELQKRKEERDIIFSKVEKLGLKNLWSNGYVYEFEFNNYRIKITDQECRCIVSINKKMPKEDLEIFEKYSIDIRSIEEIIEFLGREDNGMFSRRLGDIPVELVSEIKNRYLNEITGVYQDTNPLYFAVLNAIDKIKIFSKTIN